MRPVLPFGQRFEGLGFVTIRLAGQDQNCHDQVVFWTFYEVPRVVSGVPRVVSGVARVVSGVARPGVSGAAAGGIRRRGRRCQAPRAAAAETASQATGGCRMSEWAPENDDCVVLAITADPSTR